MQRWLRQNKTEPASTAPKQPHKRLVQSDICCLKVKEAAGVEICFRVSNDWNNK